MTADQTTEQDEQLLEILAPWVRDQPYPANAVSELLEDLAPHLATIRRQAAADALREQAAAFSRQGKFFRDQQRSLERKGDRASADVYREQADALYRAAAATNRAADDTIAEGYEHTCAARFEATRTDPGYDCDARVPEPGDFCPGHEPADDDMWEN